MSESNITSTEPEKRVWWKQEEHDIIRLSLTSHDITGSEWVDRLEQKGCHIESHAKEILWSKEFQPTRQKVYEVAIVRGRACPDGERTLRKIKLAAIQMGIAGRPTLETACLIRDALTRRDLIEMGLSRNGIVVIHKPIDDGSISFYLTLFGRATDHFGVSWDGRYHQWERGTGFAFVLSPE